MILSRALSLILGAFATVSPLASAEDQSVVDLVVGLGSDNYDGQQENFSILYKLVVAADLAGSLSCDGLTDITVLAPTDGAFEKLAESLGYQSDEYNEEGIYNYLATGLGQYADAQGVGLTALITNVLLYHVIAGSLSKDEIGAAGELETLLENVFIISGTDIDGNVILVDGATDLSRDPRLVSSSLDISTCNGFVQVIDRVLVPVADLSSILLEEPIAIEGNELISVIDVALALDASGEGGASGYDSNAGNFDILAALVGLVGLSEALSCDSNGLKGVTVLAPTDQAFYDLAKTLGYEGGYDESGVLDFLAAGLESYGNNDLVGTVTMILQYHIANLPLSQSMMKSLGEVSTLAMDTIEVTDDGTLHDIADDVEDPKLVSSPANLITCNGFVQIIDGVLLPVDDLVSVPQQVSSDKPSVVNVIQSLDETGPRAKEGYDRNWRNFDILFRLVDVVPGLSSQLSCGGLSDVTILAPTDAAFGLLAYGIGYKGGWWDEERVFKFLADALTGYSGGNLVEVVQKVLLYHVVVDGALTQDQVMMVDTLNTALGETIQVRQGGALVDKEGSRWNSRLLKQASDIETCNGIMQGISRVLLPVDDLIGGRGGSGKHSQYNRSAPFGSKGKGSSTSRSNS